MAEKWKKSVIDLDRMLYEDARKEFTLSSMTGFGIDGGPEIKKLDFEQSGVISNPTALLPRFRII